MASKTVSSEILSTPLKQTCATTCPRSGEHGELWAAEAEQLPLHDLEQVPSCPKAAPPVIEKAYSYALPSTERNLAEKSTDSTDSFCTKGRDSGSLHLQVCTNGVI